jgi:hypothetical protein
LAMEWIMAREPALFDVDARLAEFFGEDLSA